MAPTGVDELEDAGDVELLLVEIVDVGAVDTTRGGVVIFFISV
jgi:hypothetical protein